MNKSDKKNTVIINIIIIVIMITINKNILNVKQWMDRLNGDILHHQDSWRPTIVH